MNLSIRNCGGLWKAEGCTGIIPVKAVGLSKEHALRALLQSVVTLREEEESKLRGLECLEEHIRVLLEE